MNKKLIVSLVVAVGLLLAVQAHALQLGFNDFVNPIFIVDDQGAGDINPLVGVITFSGSIGTDWIVNVTTGISKPVLGSASNPVIDLNSVNVSSATGGHLRFGVNDVGFTGPISGGFVGVQAEVGGTTTGTAFFDYYGDAGNLGNFLFSELFATLGPFGPGAFSGTTTGSFAAGPGPFGMILVADITHDGAGVTSFDTDVTVPEPISLILLGSGLAGVGLYRRIRKPRG